MRRSLLRLLADGHPSGVLALGPRDELLLCSAAAARQLGRPDAPVRRLADLTPSTRAAVVALAARARAARGPLSGEALAVDASPPRRICVDAMPFDAPGGACGVLLLLQDEQAQVAACAGVLGEVAHELRTPLTGMQSALQLVSSGETGRLNVDQRRFLEMSARSAARLGRLIDGLVDVAQAARGRLGLSRQDTRLQPLLLPVLEQMRALAMRSQRTLVWELDPDAAAFVDADRWLEVADNLVGNALKYTPRGGRVQVALHGGQAIADAGLARWGALLGAPMRGALLLVEDDGPGLSASHAVAEVADVPRARGPQAPRSCGLGLSITSALVQAHDGCLQLDSRPGQGTRARVWIPGTEPVAHAAAAAARLGAVLQGALARGARGRLRGAVVVVELPGGGPTRLMRLTRLTRDVERALRQRWPEAAWLGEPFVGVGVAAVPAAAGRRGPAPRELDGALASLGDASRGRLGWACAPAEAGDAGTLLAVAMERARAPRAAAAHARYRHAPKEACRG